MHEIRDKDGNGWDIRLPFSIVERPSDIRGDLNHDGQLEQGDVDILTRNIHAGATNLTLDMNSDDNVSADDMTAWIRTIKNTWIGDANLDGRFDSIDLVKVLQASKYETGDIAGWHEGDWNTDQYFNKDDIVLALQDGGYQTGTRAAISAVPEPSCAALFVIGMIGIYRLRSRQPKQLAVTATIGNHPGLARS